MTKRDFFKIVIKLLGLYFIILTIFQILPNSFGVLGFKLSDEIIFMTISLLVLSYIIIRFLIFKPEKIIDLLKLDKKFDDDSISLNKLDFQNSLKLSIIVIGIFLIVDNAALFIIELLNKFIIEATNNPLINHSSDNLWMAVRCLNVLMGYLLLSNSNEIAKFLNK